MRLAQTVEFVEDPLSGLDQLSKGKQPKMFSNITEIGLASWWIPPKDVIQNADMRQLQGEIHLSSELSPSSDFPPLSIHVSIHL